MITLVKIYKTSLEIIWCQLNSFSPNLDKVYQGKLSHQFDCIFLRRFISLAKKKIHDSKPIPQVYTHECDIDLKKSQISWHVSKPKEWCLFRMSHLQDIFADFDYGIKYPL